LIFGPRGLDHANAGGTPKISWDQPSDHTSFFGSNYVDMNRADTTTKLSVYRYASGEGRLAEVSYLIKS
jgi:hypothetical protein